MFYSLSVKFLIRSLIVVILASSLGTSLSASSEMEKTPRPLKTLSCAQRLHLLGGLHQFFARSLGHINVNWSAIIAASKSSKPEDVAGDFGPVFLPMMAEKESLDPQLRSQAYYWLATLQLTGLQSHFIARHSPLSSSTTSHSYLEQAYRLNPQDPHVLSALAESYWRSGLEPSGDAIEKLMNADEYFSRAHESASHGPFQQSPAYLKSIDRRLRQVQYDLRYRFRLKNLFEFTTSDLLHRLEGLSRKEDQDFQKLMSTSEEIERLFPVGVFADRQMTDPQIHNVFFPDRIYSATDTNMARFKMLNLGFQILTERVRLLSISEHEDKAFLLASKMLEMLLRMQSKPFAFGNIFMDLGTRETRDKHKQDFRRRTEKLGPEDFSKTLLDRLMTELNLKLFHTMIEAKASDLKKMGPNAGVNIRINFILAHALKSISIVATSPSKKLTEKPHFGWAHFTLIAAMLHKILEDPEIRAESDERNEALEVKTKLIQRARDLLNETATEKSPTLPQSRELILNYLKSLEG